jgi:hypothetical protein
MTLLAVSQALGTLGEALRLDGYAMQAALSDEGVRLTIDASPEACADCLSPDVVLAGIARDSLARHDIDLPVTIVHTKSDGLQAE